MKKFKKLSVVFMIATLFSASFTSCIDNEVYPVVEAIYEAQADLIAAQAAVQNAEVALLQAEAAAQQAQADLLAAQTAQVNALTEGIIADNAYAAAVREQELRSLVAQTDLDLAQAQMDLEVAQAQFELDMQALMAQLEAAGVQLAIDYAYQYTDAMNWANMLMEQLLTKQAELAQAELLLKNSDESWAYYLAGKEAELAALEALLEERNATQAEVEALIAAGGTADTQYLESLRTERDDIKARILAIEQETVALLLLKDEKMEALNANSDLIAAYLTSKGKFDTNEALRDGLVADNEALQADIDTWQDWLDNYDTTEATLQTAVDDALALLADLETALADARAIRDAAQSNLSDAVFAKIDADDVKYSADTALSTLEGEIAMLYAELQGKITALASAQATFDAGIGALETALTNAQNAVTAAETALGTPADMTLGTAWGDYNYWKGVFEGDPTGDTWFDGTDTGNNPYPFETPLVGDHTDAIATSYVKVLTWEPAPSNANRRIPATWTTVTEPELTPYPAPSPVVKIDYNARTYAQEGISEANSLDGNKEYYLEVEADDYSVSNEDLLNTAVAALGNEDIFDVAPVLGDMPYGTSDAFATLWDAQLAEITAQDAVDTFDDALIAAQAEYDYWKNLYENQLALLDAAQQAVVDAQADVDAAQAVVVAAQGALAAAQDDVNVARNARNNQRDVVVPAAESALATFQATTKEQLQTWIDTNLATIADNDLYIAEYEIFMAEYQAEMDAIQAEYEALLETPLDAAAFVEIEDLQQQIDALDLEKMILQGRKTLLTSKIQLLRSLDIPLLSDVQAILDAWIVDSADLADQIEAARNMIASGTVDFEAAQAYLTLLQAQIDTILQRHANALAIAAKYKALMDAALAS